MSNILFGYQCPDYKPIFLFSEGFWTEWVNFVLNDDGSTDHESPLYIQLTSDVINETMSYLSEGNPLWMECRDIVSNLSWVEQVNDTKGLLANPCNPKHGIVCDGTREDDGYCLDYEGRYFFERGKYKLYRWRIYITPPPPPPPATHDVMITWLLRQNDAHCFTSLSRAMALTFPGKESLGSSWVDFYLRPVSAFEYCHRLRLCVCPCVCVNHLLVRTITHQPFKLASPNLGQRCKTPCLRCLLFGGVIDLDLQGQIELESRILPHFELVRTITFHLFKLESPNLDQNCILG